MHHCGIPAIFVFLARLKWSTGPNRAHCFFTFWDRPFNKFRKSVPKYVRFLQSLYLCQWRALCKVVFKCSSHVENLFVKVNLRMMRDGSWSVYLHTLLPQGRKERNPLQLMKTKTKHCCLLNIITITLCLSFDLLLIQNSNPNSYWHKLINKIWLLPNYTRCINITWCPLSFDIDP